MSDIKFGNYYNIKSDIHSMNSIFKLICLLIYSILLFLINDIILITMMSSLLLILIYISNVEIKLYFVILKNILPLILFIFIINILFGLPVIDTIISITKVLLIVLYASMISFSTTPKEMTKGIEKIIKPLSIFGVNTSKISFTISMAIRFIPIILNQSRKVLKSQSSRGLNFKNLSIKDKVLSLKSILFPMFMLSMQRSDRIADIMELRCYKFDKKKYKKEKIKSLDYLILTSHLMLIILCVYKYIV